MGSALTGRGTFRAACVALVLLAAAPCAARAQEADGDGANAAATGSASGWLGIFGRESERRRVIPAFWRTHPFDQKFPELAFTRGVGVQASGWLGGAFLNSYERLFGLWHVFHLPFFYMLVVTAIVHVVAVHMY